MSVLILVREIKTDISIFSLNLFFYTSKINMSDEILKLQEL